jgi:hypothetical protein
VNSEHLSKFLARFASGFPAVDLIAPAIVGDGIIKPDTDKQLDWVLKYRAEKKQLDILKFVPASGAATRMFKHLFEALDALDLQEPVSEQALYFLENIHLFPFAATLDATMCRDYKISLQKACDNRDYKTIIIALLDKTGLNFAETPKAFVPFHTDTQGNPETAMFAHFEEASVYAEVEGYARLHFTVSPDYVETAREHAAQCAFAFQNTVFEVSFSEQDAQTDTPAVYSDNSPVILDNGAILTRPGGHGALIHNLNALDADIIFIKNIDNVATKAASQKNAHFKEMLGGYLIELRNEVYEALKLLERGIDQPGRTLALRLFKDIDPNVPVSTLFKLLNAPIRICGMVVNVGAPGGGPFWVRMPNGLGALQIVESAQINMASEKQREISRAATHFNPVDMVCCIRDYKGQAFNLLEYVDPETGFITQKTYRGKSIKALELPGLWNGAMARWITVFVEVPSHTFSPVKSINDLLQPLHRAE